MLTPLIDLNAIDFDALATRLAGRKRSSARRLIGQLEMSAEAAAQRNPSRRDLVEQLRRLIDDYNAGSFNVDEMLRRLQALSRQLSEEEQRTAREGLAEPELAVFDLLTRPDPVLTDEEREVVKRVARKLMEHIQDRLVLDWRRKAQTREAARSLVKDILEELPEEPYGPEVWERKAGIVFDHIFASYYDDGGSVYETSEPGVDVVAAPPPEASTALPSIDVDGVTEEVLARIKDDPTLAELVAEQLRGEKAFFAVPSEELIGRVESFDVEFKSTARWNLREGCKDKRMEDAVVKTVAGFLNTDGGTLLIGVGDDGRVVGLENDLPLVKPQSADGLLNWLTTHLVNALTHAAAMRTRARIEQLDGGQICRVDVASSSTPVKARMSEGGQVFWVRMNNSTRSLPEIQIAQYVRDHWG